MEELEEMIMRLEGMTEEDRYALEVCAQYSL